MNNAYIKVEKSKQLSGSVELVGAKNAVLVIMASLLLTRGKSTLRNIPRSSDVYTMIALLQSLGAIVFFDENAATVEIDTMNISSYSVSVEIMQKMRASILVLGPLLSAYGQAEVAFPGGCVIGARPIDYHLDNFKKMGVIIDDTGEKIYAHAQKLFAKRIVLEYPSVGATENLLMLATKTQGITIIVNAAVEPEVKDLITVLKKMGANIEVITPATIVVTGVQKLHQIEHTIMMDRLEAGSLLCAAAITKGSISLPQANAYTMDVFLEKLSQMGHTIDVGKNGVGVSLTATKNPRAVSFKTGPYPSFPTDLQSPMMVLQCVASGTSIVHELVFENRFHHIEQLKKMGAIIIVEGHKAIITGVEQLVAREVVGSDIRATCALVLAGLVSQGTTHVIGVHHLLRAYDQFDAKLRALGASVTIVEGESDILQFQKPSKPRDISIKSK